MVKKLIVMVILFTFLITANIYAQSRNLRAGEFLIDTNVVYVPAAGDQASPSIATDDCVRRLVRQT